MNDTELKCDVLVVGGGISGVVAGLAASRSGAKTILIENKPFVGGNATTGLCLHSYITRYGKQVVFGIAQELVDELIDRGGTQQIAGDERRLAVQFGAQEERELGG